MGQTPLLRSQACILDTGRLLGFKVENLQGQPLGKIETLIIDVHAARVAGVVLSVGGFLGFGEKLLPLPFDALMFGAAGDRAIVDVDPERLDGSPADERDELPDIGDPSWVSAIYRHYGYTPQGE